MSRIAKGLVAIQPPGALGVSFLCHLTDSFQRLDSGIRILDRPGSTLGSQLASAGGIRVRLEGRELQVSAPGLFGTNLTQCWETCTVPEALILCPNPDQLLPALTSCVDILERSHAAGELSTTALPLPAMVLSSNGIYYQRIRQVFVEKLEESTLLGRLPDLWPELMPEIVGRLTRGVTIQTGIREGSGADSVYHPGPPGITRLAGGNTNVRAGAVTLLRSRGMQIEDAGSTTPTRVEFDKALINLAANLLGLSASLDESGLFRPLTIGEILQEIGEEEVRRLGRAVIDVGIAVKAYRRDEDVERLMGAVIDNLRDHSRHVPSSVQWLSLKLARKEAVEGLSPTETWLLDPLIHYARSANLLESQQCFEAWRSKVSLQLSRARVIAG